MLENEPQVTPPGDPIVTPPAVPSVAPFPGVAATPPVAPPQPGTVSRVAQIAARIQEIEKECIPMQNI